MTDALELSMTFARSRKTLYADWLSSEGHSRMTGSVADSDRKNPAKEEPAAQKKPAAKK